VWASGNLAICHLANGNPLKSFDEFRALTLGMADIPLLSSYIESLQTLAGPPPVAPQVQAIIDLLYDRLKAAETRRD